MFVEGKHHYRKTAQKPEPRLSTARLFCEGNTYGGEEIFVEIRKDALSGTLPEVASFLLTEYMDTDDKRSAAQAKGEYPKVAVVPAAGFGTRLRPLTHAIPKEMLPVGGKLALEWIIAELVGAGICHIILVVSPAKEPTMRHYFGESGDGYGISYAIQPEMRGLGDAILQAEPYITENRPFVVALGDAIFEEPTPGGLTRRLCEAVLSAEARLGLAVQRVPRERISRYGVIKPTHPDDVTRQAIPITDIVEKPAPEDAPSDLAAAARYFAYPDVFTTIRETPPGKNGEIQFTDSMRLQLASGNTGIAIPLQSGEVRHDIGNLETYYRAFTTFALADAENGLALRSFLKERL
jgi:UTP--glucose-1-phosphate uridylyltransferase